MPASSTPEWVLARRREVGARIRAVRTKARLTQEALGLLSGVDRPSIVRIEAGQQAPSVDTLIRLADALGADLRDIV